MGAKAPSWTGGSGLRRPSGQPPAAPDAGPKRFVLDVSKERLEAAPGFDKDHWPTMADRTWAAQVHEYYDVQPYWDDPVSASSG